jgi:predicted nucleic acid-binding protein
MPLLIDTNVLLRAVQPSHPMHARATRALEVLLHRGETLVITLQNIAEFWNAATRPVSDNGLGFTLEEARKEVAQLEEFFQVLIENPASFAMWKSLLTKNRVAGVRVHDARLVSVMTTYA